MLICAITMMASPVEPEQARTIALNFMMQKSPAVTRSTDCTLAYTWSNNRSSALFYVYNVGNGFVIVSADDAVMPVLGYSTSRTFTGENLPDNCRAWLQSYADQIALVKEHNLAAPAEVSQSWTALAEGREPVRSNNRSVAPLLTTTWDQWPYYNILCPEDPEVDEYFGGRVPTGCVATAMAQVINYHQWPAQGFGTHRYERDDTYGIQEADFGSTTYRYDLMPEYLDEYSTPEQVNAVATLMRHCGVAADMIYAPDGSGAFSEDARIALINHFGYDAEIAKRDQRTHGIIINTFNTTLYYSDDEWRAMLKEELDAHNPILYDGGPYDLEGERHAFVCDGYDANDYFHFNWGWGYGGEYYAVGNLIPEGAEPLYYPCNNAAIFCHPNRSGVQKYVLHYEGKSTMTISGHLDISHALGYNEHYTYGNNLSWCSNNDTLVLYPQTAGAQLFLEKITYLNTYGNSDRFKIYVYDGEGTDGTLLMSIVNGDAQNPILSTSGALTLVSVGCGTVDHRLLLRATEVTCTPVVYRFNSTDVTFATAELAWEVLNSEEYAGHNFNWRVEYGPHGFTPGTGTRIPINTTSITIGGLTADTEYDAYLTYTCEGNGIQTIGPVTFRTSHVMECFDDPIVNGTEYIEMSEIGFIASAYGLGNSNTYHWSQQIYTAEEMAAYGFSAGDAISGLSLQYASTHSAANGQKRRNIAIYMGNTTKTSFESNTDWLPLETMTNVYLEKENVFNGIQSGDWKKFEFDVPFVWDGRNNVVIAFADDGTQYSESNSYFRANSGESNCCIYATSTEQPITTSTEGSRYYKRANMIFCIPLSCPKPTHLTHTSLNRHSVRVEWFPGYQETTWHVEYGPAGIERGSGTSRTINNPYLILSQLSSGYYDIYVQADCGEGETSEWVKYVVPVGDFDCAQIGEGTYSSGYFPLATNYYTYTQQLYTAEELREQGVSGEIASLAFQYSGTSQTKSSVRVFMVNTDRPNMTYYYSLLPYTEMQEVYTGSMELADGWCTLALSTPFIWDGTSNVIVAVLNNNTPVSGNSFFYAHSTNDDMAIEFDGTSPIDIDNPGHIWRYSIRSNIRFCENTTCAMRRDMDVTIVEGATYDFYGTPVSEPGTYSHRWWVNDDCDSLVVLNLSVNKIIFVTPNGSGSHDGTSWANAMQLQEAMDTCIYFTDRTPYLYVRKGNYAGNTSSTNSFEIKPNVHAYGGFVGNEPADYDLNNRTQANMAATYLNGSNLRRVLYQSEDFTEATATVLDGFTITGGTVNTASEGGGAYIRKYCTLNNCVISYNNAEISGTENNINRYGVAVYNKGGTFSNCEIHDNTINLSGSGSGHKVYGVGVYVDNGVIDHCNIHHNKAVYDGNNNWNVYGGGIYDYQSSIITNTTITRNDAAHGGGIYNYCQSGNLSQVTNCIISNNTSRENGGGAVAGAYNNGKVIFTQCLIGNNAAGSNGGGVFISYYNANVRFVACNIVRNSAVGSGGGLFTSSGVNCGLQNCIVWGNKVGATYNQLAKDSYYNYYFSIENSAVQDGYSGAIMLEPDNTGEGVGYPMFTNPTAEAGVDVNNAIGDWTLQPGSVCANLGSNVFVNEFALSTDLGGNARIQQGCADIGAYESSNGVAFPIQPEAESNIIYVTTTGAGTQDGSSWDNATANLQYAMDIAMICNPPAAVWVAEGTYTPERPLVAQPKVAVYGGFEGVEPSTFDLAQRDLEEHATIIDGDSAYRVLDKSCPFEAIQNTTYMTEPNIILMPNTGIKDITACSGTIYDNGGETGYYANNSNGKIILRSFSPSSSITLTGSYQTDRRDKLYIYEYNDGVLLGTFYDGGTISLTYPTSAIMLEFTSDGSYNNPGFAIDFSFSDCDPVIPEQNESSFRSGESLFDGLTFQNGFVSDNNGYSGAYLLANTDLLNCTFSGNHKRGVYAADCRIDNCLFKDNKEHGLYCEGLTNVSNCTAQNNKCGIYFSSTGTLSNSTMRQNTNNGLRIYNGKVEGCVITDNGTSDYGVYSDGENVRIINTSIINNNGGGLYASKGAYVNVNIANNTKTRTGTSSSAVYAGVNARNNARFVNCNIVNNKVELVPNYVGGNVNYDNAYAGIFNVSTNNEYTNCIVWGNKADTIVSNLQGEGTFSYCAIEGDVDGLGIANISLDSANYGEEEELNYVHFVRPTDKAGVSTQDTVDYNLAAGSACINAGNSSNTSLQLPTYDLGGSLRIKQQRIDIGAYEFGDVNILPINDEICLGEGFNYQGHLVFPEEPGLFMDTFIYNQGMNDYIAYINLQVNPVYNINIDTAICEGESYFFNGQNYTSTTTVTANLWTTTNCDSIVILNLTVNPIRYSEFSANACDSFRWNQTTYYETGDYEQTLQSETGCDSIVTLHLTVHYSIETVDSLTICRSALPHYYQSVIIGENTPEHDTIPVHLATSHGCDSTVYLRVTVVDVITNEFSDEACDLYVWNGQTYTTGGDKVQSFVSSIGCDSIVTLHLTIHHSNTYEFSDAACYQYVWNNETYTESGDYQQVFTNAEGCDSTVTLHLTILTSSEYAFSAEACDQYQWNSSTYTESGIYQQSFTNAAGCDSTATLTLTVHHSTSTALTATVCETELPYHYVNGQIDTTFEEGTPATQSTFVFNFQTVHGCDSTVTLNLTVVPVAAPQLTVTGQITACQSSSATLSVAGSYTSYLWSTGATTPTIEVTMPGFYWVSLVDENGCASMTEVTQLGVSTLIPETPAICMVGVENGHNLIVWEELENTNVQNYRIYRENDQANVYELLATVPASQGNAYEDVTADPSVRAYRYKVTAMDDCQGETPMSEMHKNVHLTINRGINDNWNLIWTHYEGFEFPSYRLYRGTANNNLTLIATLPSTLTSYTDYDNVDGALFYQIEVVMNGSCLRRSTTYTGSRSNIVYNGEAVYTDTAVLACESYEWLGNTYTQSGVYQQNYTSELGYNVYAVLHLTIATPPVFSISGATTITSGGSTTLSVPNNPQWSYLWSTGATTNSITVSPTQTTAYYVTVTNGPCVATAGVNVTVVTGVNEWGTADLHIYPNPTTGIVNVELGTAEGWKNGEIQVFDVYGRMLTVVETMYTSSLQIDLSRYATGVYMLKVVNDGKVVAIGKVVKE